MSDRLIIWLYGRLLSLFPRSFRDAYADEAGEVFACQWRDASGGRRRLRTFVMAFGRLPAVLAAQWWDAAHAWRLKQRNRSGGSMRNVWHMVRYGARSLGRNPAFSLSVVLLLGLGVGSVSAIWTVVDHVLLRPLPYPEVERLFEVQNGSHSGPLFEDFRGLQSAEAWTAVRTDEGRLTGQGEPLRVVLASVTPGFFGFFGARPMLGRLLIDADFEARDGVVLSHGAWRRIFGADTAVIGRTIRVDDTPHVVLGVLDPSFAPPEVMTDPDADIWRPLDLRGLVEQGRGHYVLAVAGRLAPGKSIELAQQEMDALVERLARDFPDHHRTSQGQIEKLPVVALQESTVGPVRRGLGLLLGAVSLLLLVACANVTHLFLARGVARSREMSVRRALGASTGAVAAQLLVESLMLGAAGALVGVALAHAAVQTFLAVNPGGLPRLSAVSVDLRVLGFAIAVGLTTAVVFGLLPALRLAGGRATTVLRSAGRNTTASRRARAIRSGLVMVEVALSLVLVAHAGWLLRSFVRLHQQPLGFRTENVVTIPLTPTGIETIDEWRTRMDAIRSSLAATPGVTRATYGMSMPLEFTGGNRCCWMTRLTFGGRAEPARALIHAVDADYFDVFALRLVSGGSWDRAAERGAVRPAVVTEPLAIEVFGNAAGAVGSTFTLGRQNFQVIGVVADHRHFGPDQEHGPAVFVPISALPFVPITAHLAVATTDRAPDLGARLRSAVWRTEPELPVPVVRSMSEWAGEATARARFESTLVTIFAAVALLLVAGGVAGTLFYTVNLERRDLGIRMALGATAARLERRVLARGVGTAAVGAAIGTAAALATGRLIESRLFGVDARDVRTLALAIGVLLFFAIVSSWLPARKAARTDPLESLRAE